MQNLLDEFAQWEKKVDDIMTDIAANNSQEAPEDFANVQSLVQVLLTTAAQGKKALLVSPINFINFTLEHFQIKITGVSIIYLCINFNQVVCSTLFIQTFYLTRLFLTLFVHFKNLW
jgi:hypothetical protein